MAHAEFEEKTYEQLLTFELLKKQPLFIPPGQKLEHLIGFDVGLFTRNRHFWRMLNGDVFRIPWWRHGIHLDPTWWSQLDQQFNYFPPFRCNVFVQYKRPDFLGTATASEWTRWSKPYFRYAIEHDQQTLLESLAVQASDLAVVVYASPVFYTYSDLWKYSSRGLLVANSNFAETLKLKGHNRYSYVDPGRTGYACSDPEEVLSFDFLARLGELANSGKSDMNNVQFLSRLGEIVHSMLSDHEKFGELYLQMTERGFLAEMRGVPKTLYRLSAFTLFTNSVWMIRTI